LGSGCQIHRATVAAENDVLRQRRTQHAAPWLRSAFILSSFNPWWRRNDLELYLTLTRAARINLLATSARCSVPLGLPVTLTVRSFRNVSQNDNHFSFRRMRANGVPEIAVKAVHKTGSETAVSPLEQHWLAHFGQHG